MKNIMGNREVCDNSSIENQAIIWVEEMSELTKELTKGLRYGFNERKSGIIEEMIDVEICLDQIKYYLDVSNEFEKNFYNYKVDRQLRRMKNEITNS